MEGRHPAQKDLGLLTPRKVTARQVVREVFAFLLLLAGIMLSAAAASSLTLRYLASNGLMSRALAPPVNDILLMLVVSTALIFCAILLVGR